MAGTPATGEGGRPAPRDGVKPALRDGGGAASLAIGLVLASSLFYVAGYSLTKVLVETHGLAPLQVTFLRCLMVLAAAGLATGWPAARLTWRRILTPRKAWLQRAAAAALVTTNVLTIVAYSTMPVTIAAALGFLTPLMLTALSGWLLREPVAAGRWAGTLLGFLGMLLIVRPSASPPALGLLAALGAALSYALYQIATRRLRDAALSHDGAIQVAVVGSLVLLVPAFLLWQPVPAPAWGLTVGFVVVQTAGLVCLNAALHRGEASRLAPWQFSGLLWAMGIDLLLFSTLPPALSVLGGGLIVAGGLLAQRRARRPTPSGDPSR
ncbi:DMT family transporter [Roseospirillum parvum]|uniref:Permease of the drug/metabolite transporter (DMT) superfamily n=1 Tax=Roseospirillum parvum TaxID=83401 RepID=A0A1G8CPJ4_9PROT|nr:DMT family transporter [Roseospirillum parvum]SDH47179.1 Permease of the drug/metabolite transporter (DMT) superfamily [Roseospirillum parvum]